MCVFGHRSLQNRESYKSLVLNVNSEEYRFVFSYVSAWMTKFIGFRVVLRVVCFVWISNNNIPVVTGCKHMERVFNVGSKT